MEMESREIQPGEVMDQTIDSLEDVVGLFDSHLERLCEDIRTSPFPDASPEFDRADWFAGLGFVACQGYMTDVRTLVVCRPKDTATLLRLGPVLPSGQPFALVVSEAANHWKHRWESEDRRTTRRANVLKNDGGTGDYSCFFALVALCEPEQPRFGHLLPRLIEWRDAVWADSTP